MPAVSSVSDLVAARKHFDQALSLHEAGHKAAQGSFLGRQLRRPNAERQLAAARSEASRGVDFLEKGGSPLAAHLRSQLNGLPDSPIERSGYLDTRYNVGFRSVVTNGTDSANEGVTVLNTPNDELVAQLKGELAPNRWGIYPMTPHRSAEAAARVSTPMLDAHPTLRTRLVDESRTSIDEIDNSFGNGSLVGETAHLWDVALNVASRSDATTALTRAASGDELVKVRELLSQDMPVQFRPFVDLTVDRAAISDLVTGRKMWDDAHPGWGALGHMRAFTVAPGETTARLGTLTRTLREPSDVEEARRLILRAPAGLPADLDAATLTAGMAADVKSGSGFNRYGAWAHDWQPTDHKVAHQLDLLKQWASDATAAA